MKQERLRVLPFQKSKHSRSLAAWYFSGVVDILIKYQITSKDIHQVLFHIKPANTFTDLQINDWSRRLINILHCVSIFRIRRRMQFFA